MFVGDSCWGSDVSVSVWAKLSGLTSVGWFDCHDVAIFADTDPAGSSAPSASAGID